MHTDPLKIDADFVSKIHTLLGSAGDIAMKHFNPSGLAESEFAAKKSFGPVSKADVEIHSYIADQLNELFSLPVLSEESTESHELLRLEKSFFVVDPLDGTKEYISGSEDFVINIALIDSGTLVAGFIYAPATKELWHAAKNHQATKMDTRNSQGAIEVSKNSSSKKGIVSKNHVSKKDAEVAEILGCSTFLKRGSALKFCLLAQGDADVYVRLGTTMIWDTLAAEIIVRSAGGHMYYVDENSNLIESYRQLKNIGFICSNCPLSVKEIDSIQLAIR